MAKYLVAADQFSLGHFIEGDLVVNGHKDQVWVHEHHKRGAEVEMSEKDAERHLTDGTLVKRKDDLPVEGQSSQAYDDAGRPTGAPASEGAGDSNAAKDQNAKGK